MIMTTTISSMSVKPSSSSCKRVCQVRSTGSTSSRGRRGPNVAWDPSGRTVVHEISAGAVTG